MFAFRAGVAITSFISVLAADVDLGGPSSNYLIKKYVATESVSALGFSVSKAGDVNGDQKLDFIAGGYIANGQGVAYVVFGTGSATNFAQVNFTSMSTGGAGFKIYNGDANGQLGWSVSGGGDFNNDSFDDIIVAAPSANYDGKASCGKVFVFFGHSTATTFDDVNLYSFIAGSQGFIIFGAATYDRLGYSVAFAGDFNGDSRDDIVIGSVNGKAYVLLGRPGPSFTNIDMSSFGFEPSIGFTISGSATAQDGLGRSVAAAGDIDGDGKKDIIIGAPLADVNLSETTRTDSGATYVVVGRSDVSNLQISNFQSGASSGFKILGATAGDGSGSAVSGAGDINGDGVADMLVGAPSADPSNRNNAGTVYVIFGRNSSSHGNAAYSDIDLLTYASSTPFGFSIVGGMANDNCGWSVSAAGDWNMDGVADIVVGANLADPGSVVRQNAGVVYVIFGRDVAHGAQPFTNIDLATMLVNPSTGFRIFGAAVGDSLGIAVSSVGDLNGDGSDDIIVGAPSAGNPSGIKGGIAYVVFGVMPTPTMVPTLPPVIRPTSAPTVDGQTFAPSRPPTINPTCSPVYSPTPRPSRQPTSQPTRQPSSQPSRQPTSQPTRQPVGQPTSQPSGQPVSSPSAQPSAQPVAHPSHQPSGQPSKQPVAQPSAAPSDRPTSEPSKQPSSRPTSRPTSQPVGQPSRQPTVVPSAKPSGQPTSRPSLQATGNPTSRPTSRPNARPSAQPTSRPSAQPTGQPTSVPTARPTLKPTSEPSSVPDPSAVPSAQPTSAPSSEPTGQPTSAPTSQPSAQPTAVPTTRPTYRPSAQPTSAPTSEPSGQPTSAPSAQPTSMPTARSSAAPTPEVVTVQPSRQPSVGSTSAPTELPSVSPSCVPSLQPSALPTVTAAPTPLPTMKPSFVPSRVPTLAPSRKPSALPTVVPSVVPTVVPTVVPGQTQRPSRAPTAAPSLSLEALWRAELAVVLSTAPADSSVAVVHRSTYYELDVSTAVPSTGVYGSCSAWRSLLNGDIATSKALYKPVSVELVYQHELSQESTAARCDDASTVSTVLNALTDTTSTTGQIQSFPCGEDTWVVRKCAASSVPALCVGCDDPCAATNHCSSGDGSTLQSSISPCVTTSCTSGASLVSELRLLRVAYAESVPAPSFLSRSVVSTTTSLTVTAVLSAPGSVYCAAYLLDSQSDVIPAPTSVGNLMLQSYVNATDATNTSIVTISGLQSATDFMVYCMSVSRTGSVQSLSDVLAQPLTPSTTCCIPVVVQTSSVAVRESQVSNNFLTMTVNARPSVDIEVSVAVVNSTGGAVFPVPLFPASFRLNALSTATATFGLQSSIVSTSAQMRIQTATMTSSLLTLPVGNYTYEVTISGASASQYGVVYTQAARSITVLPGSAALPAPVLTSAVFSDDGSHVALSFDSNTDRCGFATQFTCSALFSFACASASTCVWASNKQVKAYVSGAAGCIVVGSTITLTSNGVLRAQCPSCTAPDAASWPTSSVTSVVVAAPSSGVTPSVVISAPSTVGACDSLTLDISSSSGNGGRPWLSRSIQVETAATVNVTDLQFFLTHKYQASPPTAIPAALLSKGHSYNFVVTLCNFLGECSQASKRVLAVDRTVPTVLLPGDSLRTTARSATLSISSSAYTLQCNGGSAVRSGLTYAWTVSNGGAVLLNMVSTSKDPSKFVLPPYSLQVGTTYDVTLAATVTATAQSASATVQVYVQQGNIRAVIAGGTSQTVRAGEILILDVSGSYDEDQAGKTGLGAGLVATWSCAQVQPNYDNSCGVVAHAFGGSSDDGKMTFFILSKASAQDSVVQVSLFLLDETRTRSAETVITVTVVTPLSPSVALTSNVASTGVFNSNRELQLTATVSLPASFNGTAVWSVDDTSNFDFASAVMSPVSVYLAPIADGAVSTVYLVLAANTLPGRSTLTFSLTAMVPQIGLSNVGSVEVTVNAPPQAGTFAMIPVSGVEILDQFAFLADRWFDTDLPLLYQFAYVSVSGAKVTVRSKLEVAHGSTTLLAGLAVRNFSVSCVAQVFDSLSASSIATVTVQVFKEPARSAVSLSTIIAASLSDAASSVDGLKQATALGSYLLNDVDCSAAPNCTTLHRDECFRTANTCGECLSSAYVGDAGDSNHACVEIGSDFHPESAFQSCDGAGKCVSVPKSCPFNCSSPQGRCMFVNADTGAEVEACFVGATDCNAVCDCEEDFIGSETCSLNSTQLLQKQALRSQVIQGIRDLVSLEDPDQDTVAGWVESVVSASQSPDELSQDGVTSLLDTVTTVLRSAKRTAGVSVDMISRLMRSVDASVQASANAQRRRRRLQGRGVNELTTRLLQETAEALNSTLARTESILSIYRSFAADSLLVGQDSVSLVLPQFRVLVQKQSLVGMAAAGNVTVSAPSTVLEGLNGQAPNSVSVPVLGEQSSLSVSLTTMRSELYNTELYLNGADQVFSSPLSVDLSDTACDGSGCRFEMVLQVASEIASFTAAKSSPLTHNTTCDAGDVSNHTYICPDGNSVTARCPGYASTVISRCPADSFAAVCNFVGGSGVADSGCIMVASTDTNVTCSCPLPQSRRMLQQSADDDDAANNAEASVSYVAMLSQVKDNFEQTILSAQGLDASTVEDGFSAILTVGCIAAVVLFGLSWAHHADADAAKVKPKSESGKKKKVAPTASKTGFMQSARNLFTRKTSRNRAIAPATKWCVNKDVQIAEQALPAILSSTSLTHRVKDEIKNRHKWLGIVFFFSPSFPRVLRVISLATNVIIMLFIQSLTYALTNPDDGLCETYLSKPACLEPDSPYATGASKCYWTESTGECAVVQPDSSVKVILFVAIFSAIIATPLALLIDWLVFNVLSAPTRTAQNTVSGVGTGDTGDLSPNLAIVAGAGNISERRNSSRKRSSLTGTVRGSIFGNAVGADGNTIEHTATLSAQSDMSKLVQELTAYRATLTAEQKVEFDAIWGLDENGYFCSGDEHVSYWSRAVGLCKSNQRSSTSTSTNVAQHVLTDLKSVHSSLLIETATATDVRLSDQEKGKRLLFLFQCDLLPGISGKILDSKGKRDNLTVRHVSFESKVAVWTFLAAANVGMLFYILLFALSQTVHRQGAWALSFVMWLVVEVLFVSSATVLFTHVFIPSLIMQDVNKIKLKLVDSIRAFNKGVRSRNRGASSQKGPEHFNAAEYLFVSTRLAAQSEWSELREAQIIALFRTPWPKQSYQRESDVSQTYSRKYAELYRSVSIVAIFFLTNLLQIPPAFQDMVIQMCTTAAVGYTVLLHIDLYDVFPALVIIPCLIIGLLVYALIRYNAKRARRRLEKTFPMDDVEDVEDKEEMQAVEVEIGGDYQDSDALNGKQAAFQTVLPASAGDAEDEVIARAALDLAQSGELHLPPPDVAAPQGLSRGGHTTRKQSVIAGLRVLNVLQETHGPSAVSGSVSESQDQSDSDTDYQAESKQGEHENVYSENLYSVDELYDSVGEQEESGVGIVNAHKPEVAAKQSAHLAASVSLYSMTPSEEEAMYGGFDGDSDVEETYFSDVDEEGGEEDGVEEDAKRDGEGSESDEGESGEESGEEEEEEEGEDGEEGSGREIESEGEDEGSDGDGEGSEAEY